MNLQIYSSEFFRITCQSPLLSLIRMISLIECLENPPIRVNLVFSLMLMRVIDPLIFDRMKGKEIGSKFGTR